ncbi:MAG TPA: response regulator, partial [Vicinamibacterales bacterium]|nr:response regulator [Vicinamibacterales bacterium]
MTPYPTTVMVVDDDVTLRESVRAIAARRGFSSLVPDGTEEALRCFRQRPPSAVVLDVILPDQRGLDTLKAFKEIDPQVPVLVVSGHGQ